MAKKKIAIIDYQLSNLKSVEYACAKVGFDYQITTQRADVAAADGLILPGVGAFGDAMQTLYKHDLVSIITEKVAQGCPFMGVCLGLQLVFTESEEFGQHTGLNIVPGKVKKFPAKTKAGEIIKIPQIAWNQIETAKQTWQNTPFQHMQAKDFVYFVHSYYVIPEDDAVVLSTTEYSGFSYCSSILYKNVFATQFHPEKSAEKGVRMYHYWGKQNNIL